MEELDENAVATEEAAENAAATEEAVTTSPRSGRKRKRKDAGKKKARKETPSESSDEEYRKFSLQARTKVPTLEKGMTYAKYKTNVDMWKIAMKGYMSKKDMGMALLQALPNEDNRGARSHQVLRWMECRQVHRGSPADMGPDGGAGLLGLGAFEVCDAHQRAELNRHGSPSNSK